MLNILSNIGGSQELIGALTKLPSLDLKMKEGELSDKISLAKLKQSRDKKFEFEKRLGLAEGKRKQAAQILGGKSFDQLSKEEQKAYNRLQTDINFLLRLKLIEFIWNFISNLFIFDNNSNLIAYSTTLLFKFNISLSMAPK